jgi:hypothetical protein
MVRRNGDVKPHVANWYEERLAKEQLYKIKPEVRVVSRIL